MRALRKTVAFAIAGMLPLLACSRPDSTPGRAASPAYAGAEAVSIARITFDDGDTFYVDGNPIRVLGIDTPEIRHPSVGILTDQPYGRAAAESTRVLIERSHGVEIAAGGFDRYHRRLAHVFVDGELLAVRLLEMGLAYETVSHYGDNGFPDLADRVLRASAAGPRPVFEEPYRWRRENQRREPRDAGDGVPVPAPGS
ncbi:MAG TPA: thermonuclease family protein [Candidatus Krumholzibacteria bacterium]|nr:thermonuclease family protein [Candidatus Krumholzibacteria bacterium]